MLVTQDPFETSPLWHPGHAHTLITTFAPGKVIRMVAQRAGAVTADSEAWIERPSGLRDNPRLIQ